MGRTRLPDDQVCLATLHYRQTYDQRRVKYQENKESIQQYYREKYRNDKEYREKCLARKRQQYHQNKPKFEKITPEIESLK